MDKRNIQFASTIGAKGCLLMMFVAICPAEVAPPKNTTSPSQTSTPNEVVRDLGRLEAGQTRLPIEFTWTNETPKELMISKVVTSCGCTTLTYPKEPIRKDETCKFVMEVSLDNLKGNAEISAVVIFADKAHLPIRLRGKFFVPERLQSLPTRVDFGEVVDAAAVKRGFILPWVSEPQSTGMSLQKKEGTAGSISYRLVAQRDDMVRLPNAEKQSREQRFTFEVQLAPDVPAGEINETLQIPLRIDNRESVAVVPIRATILPRYHAVPSAVVHTYSPGADPGETTVRIRSRRAVSTPVIVEAKSDTSSVTVVVKQRQADKSAGAVVAELVLRPNIPKESRERRDGNVQVTVVEGQETYKIDLVVSFIPVPVAGSKGD